MKRLSCKEYLTDCVDCSFALTETVIKDVSTPEFGKVKRWKGFLELNEETKNQEVTTPPEINDIIGKDTYAYIFTSGTTGLPKAAPMRHVHIMGSIYGWGGMANNMKSEDVVYITLPLFHLVTHHLILLMDTLELLPIIFL